MPGRTFGQYLLDVSRAGKPSDDFAHILSAVAMSVKLTATILSRGALIHEQPPNEPPLSVAEVNHQVRQLAIQSLLAQTASIDQLAAISVAGDAEIYQVSESGRYLLAYEALHGMGNLTDNLAVGSVFSILERTSDSGPVTDNDFLQPGSKQVSAGIELYGPRTTLVVTTGKGVDGFTLDRELGSFVLTDPQLTIPPDTRVFAINATDARYWPAPVKRYVDECVQGVDGPRGQDFAMRWNASALVGAFRVLNSGGLFMAPDTGRESGWLALVLHNAAPLAFLAEQAGGRSSTGSMSVMDVVPASLTSRTPYFLGSADEVNLIERYFTEHEKGLDAESAYPLFRSRSLFFD